MNYTPLTQNLPVLSPYSQKSKELQRWKAQGFVGQRHSCISYLTKLRLCSTDMKVHFCGGVGEDAEIIKQQAIKAARQV